MQFITNAPAETEALGAALASQRDLMGIFACLMR